MLALSQLSSGYQGISVLKSIQMTVGKGEIVALIGANGAGKSTLLRTISGMIRPTSGVLSFEGKDISRLPVHSIVRLGISHVPERRGIFANLTVLENLEMGGYTQTLSSADFAHVFQLFPRLAERKKQVAGTLSGGEQQMLSISRALLSKPRLMLLDEPSLGLAPQVTRLIFDTIETINRSGTTVLLVEQNAMAALKVSHRAYVLEVGEIVGQGPSKDLLQDEKVRKAYLGEA